MSPTTMSEQRHVDGRIDRLVTQPLLQAQVDWLSAH
jgi:hypothetical protein